MTDGIGFQHRFRLFRELFLKEVRYLMRYPVNTIGHYLLLVGMFTSIFLGGNAAGVEIVTDSLDGIIVGFFLFTMASGTFHASTRTISEEAKIGTLQLLHITPFGLLNILTYNLVVHIVRRFLISLGLLAVMLLMTGESLSVRIVSIGVVSLLALVQLAGVGFFVGGLAVLYKNVGGLSRLMWLPIAALIAVPVGSVPFLEIVPLPLESHVLRLVMIESLGLLELPPAMVTVIVLKSVIYFGAGVVAFRLLSRRARRYGVLGDY